MMTILRLVASLSMLIISFQIYLLVCPLLLSLLKKKRLFSALRRYSLSSDVKQRLFQNAWRNSYLKWTIHSLISQRFVATVASIMVKLKCSKSWLNLKQNQPNSSLPSYSPILHIALSERIKVTLIALMSSSFYRPFQILSVTCNFKQTSLFSASVYSPEATHIRTYLSDQFASHKKTWSYYSVVLLTVPWPTPILSIPILYLWFQFATYSFSFSSLSS